MRFEFFMDPQAFKDAVFPFLLQNEAQNCVKLGVIENLIVRPSLSHKTFLAAVRDDAAGGAVVATALMTPPHPLGLSPMSLQALHALFKGLRPLHAHVSSVLGPTEICEEMATRLKALQRFEVDWTRKQRIYQLEKVVHPPQVPKGRMRLACGDDFGLLVRWNEAFAKEIGQAYNLNMALLDAERALLDQNRYLWVQSSGDVQASEELETVVSMAGVSGQTPQGIRVNWVYTPAEQRGHGYASALVAALSQEMLSRGRRFCFLYTDLNNPVSNSIYQKIGYVPVSDSLHVVFKTTSENE